MRPGGHERAPLVAQCVPRRERLRAAGSFGFLRLDHPGLGGGVLGLEDAVGPGQEAPQQHPVDQRDDQHHHDGRADEQRQLVAETPAPDEEPRHRLDQVQQQPGTGDAEGADGGRDHQRAQIAQRAGPLHPHQRRHLALPRGGGYHHQHTRPDRHDHRHGFGGRGDARRRPPPATAGQHEAANHLDDEHTDAVADRGVDAADETGEQPVSGQQRRGERKTEEQRRERDPGEVQPQQPPRPQHRWVLLVSAALQDRRHSTNPVTRTIRAARLPTSAATQPGSP